MVNLVTVQQMVISLMELRVAKTVNAGEETAAIRRRSARTCGAKVCVFFSKRKKNAEILDANVAESACFEENAKGHEYAHCGMSPEGPRACQLDDNRCGTLHCQGGSMNPLNPALRSFTFQFLNNGLQVQCKSIADPVVGLSSDGSSCGSGRVCVAGSCVEMSSVID